MRTYKWNYGGITKEKESSGWFNSIAVPVPQEGVKVEYKNLSDPVVIKQVLLGQNIHHLWQVEDILFSGKTTITKIGSDAFTQYADQIIKGTSYLKS